MSEFPELQKRFIEGDNIALIDVLRATITLNLPLPGWAKGEILEALNGWRFADYATLDDAFSVKRGQFRRDKERRIAQTLWQTYAEIEDLHHNKKLSLENAYDALARSREPDDPDYQKAARTIERDYREALHLLNHQSD